MRPIIEAVPNISEGRDAAVLEALVRAADGVSGAALLNHSADPSHNRSVYTVIGEPEAVAEAVFCLCRTAVVCVDMRRHTGVHPCVGAADVVPFVPLRGVSMGDCVSMAEVFAVRLSAELKIPCILYAEAARAPHRKRLSDIRRGGFAGLSAKLGDPLWTPDTATVTAHPTAGLTSVGARDILVAFNINLASSNLHAAREIASGIRASSGGLPHVQALGLALPERGIAQVSMNLTNYRITNPETVFRAVKEAAKAKGIDILGSELIGAAPAEALPSNPQKTLMLETFNKKTQLLPP